MAYVPGFEYDIFISYATEDHDARLTTFLADLRLHLRRDLGKNFTDECVFFDREALNKAPNRFDQSLEQAARSSALLVPILTPSYATSEWCAKEWEWFYDEQPIDWKIGDKTISRLAPIAWRSIDPTLASQILSRIRLTQAHQALDPAAFAATLVEGLRLMCQPRPKVYIGESIGDERKNLRHELTRRGFVVLPETPLAFGDERIIKTQLSESKLAVHFVGQAQGRALEAIEWSCEKCAGRTVVYEVPGQDVTEAENVQLEWIDCNRHHRIASRNFDQFLQIVMDFLHEVHPVHSKIGVACEDADRTVADSIASQIELETGYRVRCHGRSLQDYGKSSAILFYWGAAEGKKLRQARIVTRGKLEAFYLAEPPPKPPEHELDLPNCLVLRQQGPKFHLDDIRPFMEQLGWKR